MNKQNLKTISFILIRYISFLLTLFAVYVGSYAFISLCVFKQYIFPINYERTYASSPFTGVKRIVPLWLLGHSSCTFLETFT